MLSHLEEVVINHINQYSGLVRSDDYRRLTLPIGLEVEIEASAGTIKCWNAVNSSYENKAWLPVKHGW